MSKLSIYMSLGYLRSMLTVDVTTRRKGCVREVMPSGKPELVWRILLKDVGGNRASGKCAVA
jgi:hypothetical protein